MNDLLLNPIHTVIWGVSFVGILISFLWMHIHKERRGYAILPLSYFLNVFFYNLALHMVYGLHTDVFTLQQLEIWSGVVRLHSLFLLIFYLIFQPVAVMRARNREDKL
jgi:hypothetical protein